MPRANRCVCALVRRTGLKGRGNLFQWGPNFAADIVVTRWKPGAQGLLELLVKQHRTDVGVIMLLGGMRQAEDADPNKATPMKDSAERSLSSESLTKILEPLLTVLGGDSKTTVEVLKKAVKPLSDGSAYVDDTRATGLTAHRPNH